MNISIDYDGCYTEHKDYFDLMAKAMQATGNKVGIITGVREVDNINGRVVNRKSEILQNLGFTPDFIHMWGETETIGNSNLWKALRMDMEEVVVHYDDDATEIKRYTDRWIIKVMNSADQDKF